MKIVVKMDTFEAIMDNAWSGAVDVCKEICKQHREAEAMQYIEDCFEGEYVTETELNDFIRFSLADMMNLYSDNEELIDNINL